MKTTARFKPLDAVIALFGVLEAAPGAGVGRAA